MTERVALAASIPAAGELELGEVALPEPGPGELLVAVRACGVCGSNLHEWRHPELRLTAGSGPTPGAAGHEIVGEVEAAGPDVDLAAGTRVVLEPNLVTACGGCDACAAGRAWFCRHRRDAVVWGFATRMLVPRASAFPLPDTIGDAAATLIEPAACGVHALRHSWTARADGRLGGVTVAVLGAGVTGLLTALAAGHLGADRVAITARHRHQADAARALGIEAVLDAEADDVRDELKALGAQLTVEAVGGRAPTLDLASRVTAPGGEIAVLGLFDAPQAVDVRRAVFRELRWFFPVTYAVRDGIHDFEVARDVVAAASDPVEALVTHRFALEDVARAFATAADKKAGVLRVVVEPTRTVPDGQERARR